MTNSRLSKNLPQHHHCNHWHLPRLDRSRLLSFLEIKSFTGRKTEDDQPVEDFIEEVKITFEAREMASAERVDFITSHLEGPEARMYSKKDRSNPDFLQDVLTQAFGEKRSSSQLLKALRAEGAWKTSSVLAFLKRTTQECYKGRSKGSLWPREDSARPIWRQCEGSLPSKRTEEVLLGV